MSASSAIRPRRFLLRSTAPGSPSRSTPTTPRRSRACGSCRSPTPAPPMEVADSLLDLVGNTPLVRLDRMARDLTCQVVGKLEFLNAGGSVKDRPAVAMIDAAEQAGLLQARRHDRRTDFGQHRRRPGHRRRPPPLQVRLRDARQDEHREDRVCCGPTAPRSWCARPRWRRITPSPTTRWPTGSPPRFPARTSRTSTTTRPIRNRTYGPPALRSGARPRAGSPTSWPASERVARSPASAAI